MHSIGVLLSSTVSLLELSSIPSTWSSVFLFASTSSQIPGIGYLFKVFSRRTISSPSRHHFLFLPSHICVTPFHIFLRNLGSTDLCLRSAENPMATRQAHPLPLNVLEKSKACDGLGSGRALFNPVPLNSAAHAVHMLRQPIGLQTQWAQC